MDIHLDSEHWWPKTRRDGVPRRQAVRGLLRYREAPAGRLRVEDYPEVNG